MTETKDQRRERYAREAAEKPDAAALARREFARLTIEDAVADVCPSCGGHIVSREAARLVWLKNGGIIRCASCGVEKLRFAS